MGITTVSATENKSEPKENHLDVTKHYRFVEPVVFMENNIEFLIFPDGSFDFDVKYNHYYNDLNSRRTSINTGLRTKSLNVQYTSGYYNKPMIAKDRFGRITRISDTRIYYDRMGNVTQIGSVDIDYQRGNRMVSKVGGLKVNYNHWGQIVHTSGYVNRLNRDLNCQVSINRDSFYDSKYDDNYYYYKRNGEVKKLKKNRYS